MTNDTGGGWVARQNLPLASGQGLPSPWKQEKNHARFVPLRDLVVRRCAGAARPAHSGHPAVQNFILSHPSRIEASISSLGATLRTLRIPDRNRKLANVLIGHGTERQWQENTCYFGSSVGRYANRIAKGRFTLDGEIHSFATNNGPNHLHGGKKGFDKVVWEAERTGKHSVKFSYLSPDGEEGYPGNLKVSIEFTIGDRNLSWRATATTDKATLVNLTSHPYFNLSGDPTQPVLDHLLQINADYYLPTDETLIPFGETAPVAGTPFDFTEPVTIGRKLAEKGRTFFDHNFVVDDPGKLRRAARLRDPGSGRILGVWSDQPGIQFYLGSPHGNKNSALCLEPQKYPDSPNRPEFPSSILEPGEIYQHEILFKFPTAE